jgi:short-subunit dehydrogenase
MAHTQKKLADKTIVICGASSGIGRATALEFAKKGCTLVLAARREAVLEQLAVECIFAGAAEAVAVRADVTVANDLLRVADAALQLSGVIDVWINNAGIGAVGHFDQIPVEVHEQVIKTSLMGHLNGAHAVLPVFKQQGYGTLINTISVGGWVPEPYAVSYSAAKYGLRGFSDALRCELHNTQIHVCDVYPAYIDTPGFQHGGNYIGRKLKPIPPVFPAIQVAKAMVKLAKRPKESVYVGATAKPYKAMNMAAPRATRALVTGIVENYFHRAKPAPISSGAIFEPGTHTEVSGGWLKPNEFRNKKLIAGLVVGGLAAGFFAWKKSKAGKAPKVVPEFRNTI